MKKNLLVMLVLGVFLVGSFAVLAEERGKPDVQKKTDLKREVKKNEQPPANCVSWFDGCNTCEVVNGKARLCTKMACTVYEQPKCLIYADKQPKECTTEAKLCPDGSTVGRNGKRNCAFDPCPGEKDELKLEKKEVRLQEKVDLVKERLEKVKLRKTELSDSAKELKDERCKAQKTLEGNCGKAFEKIKEHLTKTIDRMIETFTALKTRLEKNTDADKDTEVLKKITEYVTHLEALKAKVTAAKTREELKAVMKEVRESWVTYKKFIHEHRDRLHWKRAEHLLAKAEKVHEILDAALARAKEQEGKEERVQTIERALNAVDAKTDAIKQALTQKNKDVVKTSLKELHELLKTATHQFKQRGKNELPATLTIKEAPVAAVADGKQVAEVQQ